MAEEDDRTPNHDARDAALMWFTRLHSGTGTGEDRAAFEAWLAAHPAHRREYDTLAGLWATLDHVPDPRRASSPHGLTDFRAIRRRRVMVGGMATAGLAAAAAVAFESGLADALTSDYHTGKGELRSVTLADASQVDLDADSAISVAFTATQRWVTLHHGRALFSVAKDAARPFSVAAAGGVTTALGTEFVVDDLPDGVTVSVIESAVRVVAPGGRGEVRVAAGQRVSYSRDRLGPVETVLGHAETAWRQGRLIFENQPLRDVIAALNRYRSGTIVVTSSALLALRVSGIFDVANPDQVLDAIRRTLPVQVLELTRYLVLLRPA